MIKKTNLFYNLYRFLFNNKAVYNSYRTRLYMGYIDNRSKHINHRRSVYYIPVSL